VSSQHGAGHLLIPSGAGITFLKRVRCNARADTNFGGRGPFGTGVALMDVRPVLFGMGLGSDTAGHKET